MSSLEPAGEDADIREAGRLATIADRDGRGDALMERADTLVQESCYDDAEASAREALQWYARALDWAEDSPQEDYAHQKLDMAGRLVRHAFGCTIRWDGSAYQEECPVSIAHVRVGLSVGGPARRICSLCGEDLSECPHQRGTAYWVSGGIDALGWCRVCMRRNECEHTPDQRYRAAVGAIVVDMSIEEVSLVDKPAMPEARFTKKTMDTSELRALLGPEFSPGVPLSCDRCLKECDGLIRPRFR